MTAASEPLADDLALRLHDLMLEARVAEERLIRMQKQGDGYFWIGGAGEEAFNAPLGLLVKKGRGLEHDYLHLHYRSSATYLAMGGQTLDLARQMKTVATDPLSGGRNFAGHYSARKWNLCPITSTICTQFSIAIGTALAQRRIGCTGISIVQGGDAGTAEGDFATCLVWATRPGSELPLLMIITNNGWGISTPGHTQHGEKNVADRGKAFGMRTKTIDGNDPEVAYREIETAMDYVRTERKPFLLEAKVSRLYGHSSSSGANFIDEEPDCLRLFEERLEARGLRTRAEMDGLRQTLYDRLQDEAHLAVSESYPAPESVFDHVFAERNIVGEEAEL